LSVGSPDPTNLKLSIGRFSEPSYKIIVVGRVAWPDQFELPIGRFRRIYPPSVWRTVLQHGSRSNCRTGKPISLFLRRFAIILHCSRAFSLAEPHMSVPSLQLVISHGNRFSGL